MNDEQHLTYELGMTNVPSDATCDDNGLEESIGLTYADGEHRVIQKPVEKMTISGGTLLFVHKTHSDNIYIVLSSTNVVWGTNESGTWTQGTGVLLSNVSYKLQITAIGNTVVITDDKGMHYFKWDGNGYKSLPFPLPGLGFSAKLVSDVNNDFVINTGDPEGIVVFDESEQTYKLGSQKQDAYNDLVVGLYAKNLKEVAQEKGFAEPIIVRAAYEMYDGSYTYISNPILLFPSVTENTGFFLFVSQTSDDNFAAKKMVAVTQMSHLFVMRTGNLSDYSDIIKDVVVFVSRGVKMYKTSQDQPFTKGEHLDYTIGDCISSEFDDYYGAGPSEHRNTSFTPESISGLNLLGYVFRCLQKRDGKSVNNDIESTSIFYKIASLGLNPIKKYEDITNRITQETLENIENQQRLEYDDYYSRNELFPKITYAYNSRLNLANVKRGFFHGFDFFMPLDQNSGFYYTFDVVIKTDSCEATVRTTVFTNQKQGIYFYYPDSRASHVTIYKTSGGGSTVYKILDADLKGHPFLNGAYYFAGVTPTTDEPTIGTTNLPGNPETKYEHLHNQIIQSEVNNPWLYLAKGHHTVGFAEIKGVSTITQALSQGQFGAYPLLVFSEEGIWAMSVDGTGLYNAIHPMSREVCSNVKGITQTDGAVFFPSEKGLMVVVGNDVKCVSEQLSGKSDEPFAEFLQDAVIAYDYRDGLLWIFNDESDYAWIYNIKSGTFGRYEVDVEQQQVQQQAAPLLQSGPRRSAENATLAFVTLPFTGRHTMDGTERTDSNPLHIDTSSPVELYYVGDTIKKFYLKGISTVDSQETYFTEDWTFEGHTESEYYNLYGAIMPGTLFLDDSGHYWVQGGANAILIDLGTTNPALWDQLPANGSYYFLGGENIVSYSDVDLSKEVYLHWGQNLPASAANRWVLRGKDLNGDTCYVLSGWTFKGHTESEYYDDLTTLEVNTGVLFATGTQYKISTEGNIFRTLTVAQEPTPTEYITPSVNSLSFAQAGETKTFGISSNVSWAISKSSGSDWLTVSPDSGSNDDTISVEAEENLSENSRTATLTIVDTNDGTISATVSISQAGTSPTPPTPTPADKITVVNNYPDYLIQLDDVVYSLIERPDINNDNSGPYVASMITRALKLGGGLTLKSIMRMKNIFDIHSGGTLSVEIWAKNNLNDAWVQLTHLRGVPHKYYQLRYTFTGLLATDRFAGTVLITQERRTNKLR